MNYRVNYRRTYSKMGGSSQHLALHVVHCFGLLCHFVFVSWHWIRDCQLQVWQLDASYPYGWIQRCWSHGKGSFVHFRLCFCTINIWLISNLDQSVYTLNLYYKIKSFCNNTIMKLYGNSICLLCIPEDLS